MNRLVKSAVTGLVALLIGTAAQAEILTLKFDGFVNGSRSGKINPMPDGFNGVAAGQFKFNVEDGDFWLDELRAFCIDTTTALVTAESATFKKKAAAQGLASEQLSLIGQLFDNNFSALGSSTADAAFQLALWEIIYDFENPFDLKNDSFEVVSGFGEPNGAFGLATTWLGALQKNADHMSSDFEFFVLDPVAPESNQTLLTWKPKAVPEPGSLALIAIGLLLVLGLRQRRLHARAV